jgi:hypothetical protein
MLKAKTLSCLVFLIIVSNFCAPAKSNRSRGDNINSTNKTGGDGDSEDSNTSTPTSRSLSLAKMRIFVKDDEITSSTNKANDWKNFSGSNLPLAFIPIAIPVNVDIPGSFKEFRKETEKFFDDKVGDPAKTFFKDTVWNDRIGNASWWGRAGLNTLETVGKGIGHVSKGIGKITGWEGWSEVAGWEGWSEVAGWGGWSDFTEWGGWQDAGEFFTKDLKIVEGGSFLYNKAIVPSGKFTWNGTKYVGNVLYEDVMIPMGDSFVMLFKDKACYGSGLCIMLPASGEDPSSLCQIDPTDSNDSTCKLIDPNSYDANELFSNVFVDKYTDNLDECPVSDTNSYCKAVINFVDGLFKVNNYMIVAYNYAVAQNNLPRLSLALDEKKVSKIVLQAQATKLKNGKFVIFYMTQTRVLKIRVQDQSGATVPELSNKWLNPKITKIKDVRMFFIDEDLEKNIVVKYASSADKDDDNYQKFYKTTLDEDTLIFSDSELDTETFVDSKSIEQAYKKTLNMAQSKGIEVIRVLPSADPNS